jgi:cytidylate kinase
MAIITISRGSYSKGKEVAEKVCGRLGYGCFSRDVLVEASTEFNIPEIKLVRALHDAPSVLDRFTYGKERYLAYIESAFLERVQKDNIVYHGLAGHFFLKGVSHVLKVRIVADLEQRVREEMAREGISRDEALYTLKKDDQERSRWSLSLYGMDTSDASLYDLVIRVRKITVDDAVEIICHAAGLEDFKTTPESQRILDNMVLSAQVRAKLVKAYPTIQVAAREGVVSISTVAESTIAKAVDSEIRALAEQVPGVKEVKVDVTSAGLFTTD